MSKAVIPLILKEDDTESSKHVARGKKPRETSGSTEAELDLKFARYIRSKTVNGRFCPTPELVPRRDDIDIMCD